MVIECCHCVLLKYKIVYFHQPTTIIKRIKIMNKKDEKIRSGKWQIIRSTAIESGCQSYRWELGKVGKELKDIFIFNASRKKDSNNVIELAKLSKKSA